MLTNDKKAMRTKLRILLLEGETLQFDDGSMARWAEKGDHIDDGDYTFETMCSGVFKRCLSSTGKPHWLHYGGIDMIDWIVEDSMRDYTPLELESWYVGVLANISLRQMNEKRHASRL